MDLGGKLLIAMPGMGDPRFARAVILVCAHSDEGAMGLIVNKTMPDLSFAGLLDQLNIPRSPQGRDIRVHFGGPVERGRGFVLHSPDYRGGEARLADDLPPPDAAAGRRPNPRRTSRTGSTMDIAGGFGMTATQDILSALARGGGPSEALLALGYSGWGPGQLESEIGRNDWLTTDPAPDLIFAADDAGKWAGALRRMGIDPLSLSAAAGRA